MKRKTKGHKNPKKEKPTGHVCWICGKPSVTGCYDFWPKKTVRHYCQDCL